jgi:hypothetical protein
MRNQDKFLNRFYGVHGMIDIIPLLPFGNVFAVYTDKKDRGTIEC